MDNSSRCRFSNFVHSSRFVFCLDSVQKRWATSNSLNNCQEQIKDLKRDIAEERKTFMLITLMCLGQYRGCVPPGSAMDCIVSI